MMFIVRVNDIGVLCHGFNILNGHLGGWIENYMIRIVMNHEWQI